MSVAYVRTSHLATRTPIGCDDLSVVQRRSGLRHTKSHKLGDGDPKSKLYTNHVTGTMKRRACTATTLPKRIERKLTTDVTLLMNIFGELHEAA